MRLAEALDRVARVAVGVGLRALAPAPEDVDLGAQLRAQVDGAHGLLQGEGAHRGVGRGEGAVAEDRDG